MMEFVLYHDRDYVSVRGEGAPYTLMDKASAEMIVDAAFVIFQDGTTERELWDDATILEQTRDKRAIAALKQQYKEVY